MRRSRSSMLHRRGAKRDGKVRRRSASALLFVLAGMLFWVGIPALAATPTIGKWEGTVDNPIVLGNHVTDFTAKFSTVAISGDRRVKGFSMTGHIKIPCTGGEHFATSGWTATVKPKVTDGKFKFTQTSQPPSNGKKLMVTGRFTTKTRAQGTFIGTASAGSITCTTGKLYWKAKLK